MYFIVIAIVSMYLCIVLLLGEIDLAQIQYMAYSVDDDDDNWCFMATFVHMLG